jgi:hypothetical protein
VPNVADFASRALFATTRYSTPVARSTREKA